MIHGISLGLSEAVTWPNILAAFAGVILGSAVGVLPGIGPLAAISILLPVTLHFGTLTGLVLLAGVFYGSQYGDSMAAILVNVPSEAAAIVIARDGYALTKRGRGGAALAVAGVSSFMGAMIGLFGVALLAVPMSVVAVYFRPSDYVAVGILGLLLLPLVMGEQLWKSIAAVAVGLSLATIGIDPVSGSLRFTFGISGLSQGLTIVPIAVGLFGLAELLHLIIDGEHWSVTGSYSFRKIMPTKKEWREAIPAAARGGGLGFFLGGLPGPSLVLASFGSHGFESRLLERRRKHKPGLASDSGNTSGNISGVAGPKAADDAAIGGQLVPLLSLGIPFTPVTAILLAALTLHGIQPGPLFISQNPNLFWGLLAAMVVGNVGLLILNFPFAGLWVKLLKVPFRTRAAILIPIMIVGTFAERNSMFDVVTLFVVGICGYIFMKIGINRSLIILGFVLGTFLEKAIVRSLLINHGSLMVFVDRPVSAVALAIVLAIALNLLGRRVIEAKVSSRRSKNGELPDRVA